MRPITVWFGIAIGGGLGAAVLAASAPLDAAVRREAAAIDTRNVPTNRRYPHDSLAGLSIRGDIFRVSRLPSPVPFDPRVGIVPPTPKRPKPPLQLVGIVDGTPASAVIEGFPGGEGSRVVRPGDVIGGLTVEMVSGAVVRIVGMDTTWILRVREPWRP